ncbi:hypothetical protein V8E36_004904 [Tilletia maclaganii]
MSEIASALKGMSGSSDGEELDSGFEQVLEQDGEDFEFEELAILGIVLVEKPRLSAEDRAFRDRKDARQLFLRKLIAQHNESQ